MGKRPATRRHFHDDQFYVVGQEDDRSWFARLLFPLFSPKTHTAEARAEAQDLARAEIRERKEQV